MDLTLTGITKSFDTTRVIIGVDLFVPSGSITAILGPSGCGKTTLLRSIAGFDRPDTGTIVLGDQVLFQEGRSLPPERRKIGYVVQEGALFPHMTVAENIIYGVGRDGRRDSSLIERMLKLVGMDPSYGARFPHQLSGGQQQRVALARALAPEPGVILLDEPFSSLDSRLRETTRRAVLQTLSNTGTTTILVTHDQAEALSLADQVAVMHAGMFIDVAPPLELYRRPASEESARSTGEVVILPASVSGNLAECALGRIAVYPGTPEGPCELMIRPEQIQMSADPGPNSVSARVSQVWFYGHEALVRVDLSDGAIVNARVPGHCVPASGEILHLTVEPPVHAFNSLRIMTRAPGSE